MHGRTLRSLPKSVMQADRKIPYDLSRVDEMQHDAFILWLAKDVLNKYGFYGYGSSVDKIAAHVSNGGVAPIYPRAGRWGIESERE